MKIFDKKYILLIIVSICFLLASCQSSSYTFDYACTKAIEADSSIVPPFTVTMDWKGLTENLGRSISIEIEFNNQGETEIYTSPETYYLLDDENVKFIPKGILSEIKIAAQSSTKMMLYFPIPEHYSFKNVGSLRLLCSFKYNNESFQQQSKFLRKILKYRYIERYVYPYDASFGVYFYSDPWLWHHGHHGHHGHPRHPRPPKK